MDNLITKALLVRIYPNHKQESLLKKGCLYRFHYYKALALWWNITQNTCYELYKSFCKKEPDVAKQKEYSKTLPWPPKKVSKEGLNDTCLKVVYNKLPRSIRFACVENFIDIPKKGKLKGEQKNYGSVFRLNAVYLPTIYGNRIVDSSVCAWCKDNFAQAVTKTFENKKNISVIFPKYKDANTFKFCIKELKTQCSASGKVTKINVPFLSGEYRKRLDKSIEWFDCSLSDSQLTKVKQATAMTVTCNSLNQWFLSISVKMMEEEKTETGKECGIDLGIKTTATIAENMAGESSTEYDHYVKYDLPVSKIKMLEKKIEYLQKVQMRRIQTWVRLNKDGVAKGLKLNTDKRDYVHNAISVYRKHYQSESYKKTELRIAKLNNDIANIRKNFSEQFSREIANNYDVVGLEDLNVKGMTKNHKLARAINRIGFYKLRVRLENKLGKENVKYLDRFAPSSQICSCCGYRNNKVKNLSVRSWVCPQCGHKHDRDENAASNIRPSNHEKINAYKNK